MSEWRQYRVVLSEDGVADELTGEMYEDTMMLTGREHAIACAEKGMTVQARICTDWTPFAVPRTSPCKLEGS